MAARQARGTDDDRVDKDGKFTVRHSSRLHHIGIGIQWAGTPILMLIRELNIRIITEDTGELSENSPSTRPATTNHKPRRCEL